MGDVWSSAHRCRGLVRTLLATAPSSDGGVSWSWTGTFDCEVGLAYNPRGPAYHSVVPWPTARPATRPLPLRNSPVVVGGNPVSTTSSADPALFVLCDLEPDDERYLEATRGRFVGAIRRRARALLKRPGRSDDVILTWHQPRGFAAPPRDGCACSAYPRVVSLYRPQWQTGPRRDVHQTWQDPVAPKQRGPVWPGVAAHQRSGGSAPTIAVVANLDRPVPPGAETRVVLGRRRSLTAMTAGRRTRVSSSATTTAKPLRSAVMTTGRRGCSRWLGACMRVRRRTPRLCFAVLGRFRRYFGRVRQYGWRNATSGGPHVPEELTKRTRSVYAASPPGSSLSPS